TVPAAHMKRGRAHRVPLSAGALALLEEARRLSGGTGLAFPGPGGGELGKSTVAKALARAGVGGTPHGFRSSLKDWARHEGIDELLSEFALAHVEGSRTVAAYARDDLLEKRRPVMQGWCDFVLAARSPGG
ncbi:MAG: integrase, partial [Gammaproteobacteria bacterium]|nr:integrase [Gammaproteobacteria bacterium]